MTQEEELIQLREENRVQRELLRGQQEQLAQRDTLSEQLLQRIQRLEERLSNDSQTSHLPPASDRCVRQPKSLRKKSGKKPGGQAGHRGKTLECSSTPDAVIVHPGERCQHGQQDLRPVEAEMVERRQVVDRPPPACWFKNTGSSTNGVPTVSR
jgi:transposase